GGHGALPVLRSADEHSCYAVLPIPGRAILVLDASASESENAPHVGANVSADQPMASACSCLSSLPSSSHGRDHLTQEPNALNAPVRVRAGGGESIPVPTATCLFLIF